MAAASLFQYQADMQRQTDGFSRLGPSAAGWGLHPDVFAALQAAVAVYYDDPQTRLDGKKFRNCQLTSRHSDQRFLLAEMAEPPEEAPRTLVAMQGTWSIHDTLIDLWLRPTSEFGPAKGCGGAVHSGFCHRANSIALAPFLEMVKKGTRLLFTGHSLGGSVVVLFVLRLIFEGDLSLKEASLLRVITFASPLLVDQKMAEYVRNDPRCEGLFHAFTTHGDMVPAAFSRFTPKPTDPYPEDFPPDFDGVEMADFRAFLHLEPSQGNFLITLLSRRVRELAISFKLLEYYPMGTYYFLVPPKAEASVMSQSESLASFASPIASANQGPWGADSPPCPTSPSIRRASMGERKPSLPRVVDFEWLAAKDDTCDEPHGDGDQESGGESSSAFGIPVEDTADIGRGASQPARDRAVISPARCRDQEHRLSIEHFVRDTEEVQSARLPFLPQSLPSSPAQQADTCACAPEDTPDWPEDVSEDPLQEELQVTFAAADDGMGIRMMDDFISDVRPGSQGHRFGIQVGWRVIQVNGHSIRRERLHRHLAELVKGTQPFSVRFVTYGIHAAPTTRSGSNQCLRGHTLVPFTTQGGNCDRCCAVCPSGVVVMDCRVCNYYLCSECCPTTTPSPQQRRRLDCPGSVPISGVAADDMFDVSSPKRPHAMSYASLIMIGGENMGAAVRTTSLASRDGLETLTCAVHGDVYTVLATDRPSSVLQLVAPWSDITMQRVKAHATHNYSTIISMFEPLSDRPTELPPVVAPKVFPIAKWTPYIESGSLKCSPHSKTIYMKLKGRNLDYCVRIKFAGSIDDLSHACISSDAICVYGIESPPPTVRDYVQVRVITHFGEARIHLSFDAAKLHDVQQLQRARTLGTAHVEVQRMSTLIVDELEPTCAQPDAPQLESTAAPESAAAELRPPHIRCVLTEQGVRSALHNLAQLINCKKISGPLIEKYLQSNLFAEQVADAGVELAVSLVELQHMMIPAPSVCFEAGTSRATASINDGEVVLLIAFSSIKISDYWNYRQCAVRISIRGLHTSLEFEIGSHSVGSETTVSDVDNKSGGATGPRRASDSSARSCSPELKADAKAAAAKDWEDAGSRHVEMEGSIGSDEDANTEATAHLRSSSKLLYKMDSFDVELVNVERDGCVFAKSANWGIASSLVVRVFKKLVNTMLKSESLQQFLVSSINAALFESERAHALFQHPTTGSRLGIEISSPIPPKVVLLDCAAGDHTAIISSAVIRIGQIDEQPQCTLQALKLKGDVPYLRNPSEWHGGVQPTWVAESCDLMLFVSDVVLEAALQVAYESGLMHVHFLSQDLVRTGELQRMLHSSMSTIAPAGVCELLLTQRCRR